MDDSCMTQRPTCPDWINHGLQHFAQSWPDVEIRVVCGRMFAQKGQSNEDFKAAWSAGIAHEMKCLFGSSEQILNSVRNFPLHRAFMIGDHGTLTEMRAFVHHQGDQITQRRVPTASYLLDKPLTKAVIYLPEWEQPYQTFLLNHFSVDEIGPRAVQNGMVAVFHHELGHVAHYASAQPKEYPARLRELTADQNAKATMFSLGLSDAFNTYALFSALNIYINKTSLDERNYWNWQSVDVPSAPFNARYFPNELKAVWELKKHADIYNSDSPRAMLAKLPDIVARAKFTYPETHQLAQKILHATKVFVPDMAL